MSHPLEEIPTGVDLELPVRRLLLAGVETGNPCQVIDEVRPDRCIDLHLGGEVRIHLLLHESGMKVAGIDDDQTSVGHPGEQSRVSSAVAQFGVEGVAQGVAEKAEAEDGQRDR